MHANIHVKTHSRSAGKSAVASAAYRSGSSMVAKAAYRAGAKLHGEREDITHNYKRKQNIVASEIYAPEGAPEWAKDREQLWNKVEATEKRKDAQLAKEAVLTLPRNLDHEQHREVVQRWVGDNITPRGLVADVSYHNPKAEDGGRNPHAHILFTMRPIEGDKFGKKQAGYNTTFNGWQGLDSKKQLADWRQSYEKHINSVSWEDGQQIEFSLSHEKGKTYAPNMSLAAAHMENRGEVTRQGNDVAKWRKFHEAAQAQRKREKVYRTISGHARQATYQVVSSARYDIQEKYWEFLYGEDYRDRETGYER